MGVPPDWPVSWGAYYVGAGRDAMISALSLYKGLRHPTPRSALITRSLFLDLTLFSLFSSQAEAESDGTCRALRCCAIHEAGSAGGTIAERL
ncbi:hypothetical protein GDO81_019576 [Engystomops pustulosus]|uniref:Uncharacterized protein n=1 Tax=Engystomops pustulosus TaxID=76066 RepID=A0AAV6YA00_ENGPU|nr:hypothetical protein GDO81_019576 [Engystomops pustulosus]